jgi:hypothetical protein
MDDTRWTIVGGFGFMLTGAGLGAVATWLATVAGNPPAHLDLFGPLMYGGIVAFVFGVFVLTSCIWGVPLPFQRRPSVPSVVVVADDRSVTINPDGSVRVWPKTTQAATTQSHFPHGSVPVADLGNTGTAATFGVDDDDTKGAP